MILQTVFLLFCARFAAFPYLRFFAAYFAALSVNAIFYTRQQPVNRLAHFIFKIAFHFKGLVPTVYRKSKNSVTPGGIYKPFFQNAVAVGVGQSVAQNQQFIVIVIFNTV